MRRRSARVDNALGDAFMVEVEDLFAQYEIFQQHRATRACLQAVLIVENPQALIGGQMRLGINLGGTVGRPGVRHMLMRFTTSGAGGFDGGGGLVDGHAGGLHPEKGLTGNGSGSRLFPQPWCIKEQLWMWVHVWFRPAKATLLPDHRR